MKKKKGLLTTTYVGSIGILNQFSNQFSVLIRRVSQISMMEFFFKK